MTCPKGGLALVQHLHNQAHRHAGVPPVRFVCSSAIAESIERDLGQLSLEPRRVKLRNGDQLLGMTVDVILEGYGHGIAWVST